MAQSTLLQLLNLGEADTAEFTEYVEQSRLGMAYHMESVNIAYHINSANGKVGNAESKHIKQAWEDLVDKVGGDWEALYELDEATATDRKANETATQLKTIGGTSTRARAYFAAKSCSHTL